MLDKVIKFSIANKLVIGLFTMTLIVWGSYSLSKLPIDAVPDITDNQVMIITSSPTLAAQEVEQLVTFPIEQATVSIPNIDEMRSFSRFGLSIVTIVFEEDVDLYWARQQIQERLSLVTKDIPKNIGVPEMAPVTTGLGEIYQYVVRPAKGYEEKYDARELRTIQDWIIKRQLLGTDGVAEVSSFGGHVKQYQIAIDPNLLQSMNVSVKELFEALEKNNQNTGGAYIDKGPKAIFIRSEGLIKNIDEIEKVVVKVTPTGVPILIRNVAKVELGNGVRYGAATRNGNGEVVTGIVMMLKGANSAEVVTNVIDKIEQVKTSLPEGVVIEPYLNRKKLVDRAISTVVTNLAEGALIVIFVLILFLGNLRGGLIVASVIPLSMLFAIGMMRLFGVSGNLMSLGAIDFGLIVDGAVIIVEAVMHGVVISKMKYAGVGRLTTKQMDEEVYQSSSKIRSAAAFGEIIILIVYLPILALVGVEGKMFSPMAQTVSFAILGAFLLSLTYVPMMSALALSKKTEHKRNFSDKLMDFFQRLYSPIIQGALKRKLLVLGTTVLLFVITLVTFNSMGGEFIPQLDEGDFAVETRVPVGSSIQQSIDASTKAQKIILDNFPNEVEQVVSKIGSGQIPTDPMPIEAGDMMIILKDKSEWKVAKTREGLVEKMEEKLIAIPDATFGFQQPIQMRFNELLTGAKQDVVLKIYGEDLDKLSDLAGQVGNKIKGIDGIEDLYIEEVTGLPQIQIEMNRDKIAQYGMNIADINTVITTSFAGKSAGLVYEGERRFDLVVRLDKSHRTDISDIRNIYVTSASGNQIPLSEVATVTYKPGPIQIQRDNAKRRITIGFNVRNRDVQSIVADIKTIITKSMKMPSGYYITYGGQFKNLQEANKRLAIAVPAALLFILLLLYFTFKSVKQSLLIFTAIPLSAIGGVFALLVRGMPFSISAGIGFIALFGVAVLNGIVLISEFNRLEKEGVTDVYQRVMQGTKTRLRPVLMTAMVASLGFLPMALSNTSGAEVQRPLATVVIGGLLTATILTLVILPILYTYFTSHKNRGGVRTTTITPVVVLLLSLFSFTSVKAQNQSRIITQKEAIEEALKNNNSIKIATYRVEVDKAAKSGAINLPKTEFVYNSGVLNTPDINDNLFSITQRLEFPTVYSSQNKLAVAKINASESYKVLEEFELIGKVKNVFNFYSLQLARRELLIKQDSIYKNLAHVSLKRYESGESNRLESITSETQAMKMKNLLEENTSDIEIAKKQLAVLLHTTDELLLDMDNYKPMVLEDISILSGSINNIPIVKYLENKAIISKKQTKLARNKMLPDIILGYNSQTFIGVSNTSNNALQYTSSDRFSSFQVGLAIPIFPGGNRSKIKQSKVKQKITEGTLELAKIQQEGILKNHIKEYEKNNRALMYYTDKAIPQADLLIETSYKSFKNGDVSYTQYLQGLTLAIIIQTEYLEAIYMNNQTVIAIETLLGTK
ncbi:MAG: acriflavine resistance protein B [Flavobacterium sp. MedPE-SWcel]|uniref:CusA/CzcA family heavy metal efflux RND transporter n=1 Tax=uncultured Flavobacterium sp. TaxID=165435 RepID=UPI000920D432|nr:CusA/CzcA family heavy metal efflux RND transporter [uncultured Flavobacterium sp.]OIQ18117.1 MAG: acriflavine resistance protein B [Flavobacterium sp. MedPE-SWcel]